MCVFEPSGALQVEDIAVATMRPAMNPNRAALIALMQDYGDVGYRLTRNWPSSCRSPDSR